MTLLDVVVSVITFLFQVLCTTISFVMSTVVPCIWTIVSTVVPGLAFIATKFASVATVVVGHVLKLSWAFASWFVSTLWQVLQHIGSLLWYLVKLVPGGLRVSGTVIYYLTRPFVHGFHFLNALSNHLHTIPLLKENSIAGVSCARWASLVTACIIVLCVSHIVGRKLRLMRPKYFMPFLIGSCAVALHWDDIEVAWVPATASAAAIYMIITVVVSFQRASRIRALRRQTEQIRQVLNQGANNTDTPQRPTGGQDGMQITRTRDNVATQSELRRRQPANAAQPSTTQTRDRQKITNCGDGVYRTFSGTRVYPVSECIICFEAVTEGSPIKVLSCGHSFCPPCIDAWLAKNNNCPNCREMPSRVGRIVEALFL